MLVMERSEPALVPQWLKSNGSTGGGGNRINHTASSTLHSDDHVATLPTRRLSPRVGDYDSFRSSPFTERTSSSYHRNSNGSLTHEKDSSRLRPYSNFSRSNRDREQEKNLRDFQEKDRLAVGNHRDRDYPDPLGMSSDFLMNRFEKDKLRRSKSMISGKRGEMGPRRVAADLNSNINNNSHQNFLGVGGSTIGSIHKVTFERDFPSLGTEEKHGPPETGRVSPGLSTAVQILPISTSAVIGGNGWTSALAEVPALNGINKMGHSPVQQNVPASSATVTPSMATGLNMAETLAQAPSRARTTPQVSVETQRLQELEIKKSRQLIPMTPSTPKTSVINLEKSKPKAVSRSEISVGTMNSQQQLSCSHLVNHSLRGGPAKSDVAKTGHVGKLLVLKAAREKNGVSSVANENLSPTNSSRPANNSPSLASPTSAPLGIPNIRKLASAERKTSLPLTHSSSMEKRPVTSQAQSRNDFFNLMRKKTSTNPSATADPVPAVSDNSGELNSAEVPTAPVSRQGGNTPLLDPSFMDCSTENGVKTASDGDDSGESQRFPDNEDYSTPIDEEEAAFLRSLGWVENEEEEVAITEEEIDAFNKRYMELRPSLKPCPGMQRQKLGMLFKSRVDIIDNDFPMLSSSDSDSEI